MTEQKPAQAQNKKQPVVNMDERKKVIEEYKRADNKWQALPVGQRNKIEVDRQLALANLKADIEAANLSYTAAICLLCGAAFGKAMAAGVTLVALAMFILGIVFQCLARRDRKACNRSEFNTIILHERWIGELISVKRDQQRAAKKKARKNHSKKTAKK